MYLPSHPHKFQTYIFSLCSLNMAFFLGGEGGVWSTSRCEFNSGIYVVSEMELFVLGVSFLTENSYLVFNFIDYPNGIVTLFNFLVTATWDEVMTVCVLSPILFDLQCDLLVLDKGMNLIVVALAAIVM